MLGMLTAFLLLLAPSSYAAICETIGIEAPRVVTLVVSSKNESEAWVVRPNCSFEVVPVENSSGMLSLSLNLRGIERVESYPRVQKLLLGGNYISDSDLTGPNTTDEIDLTKNNLTSLEGLRFPTSLRILGLSLNQFTRTSDIALPPGLTVLRLRNGLFADVKFKLPPLLQELELSYGAVSSLQGLQWNEAITRLSCAQCPIQSITGVRFPPSLKYLEVDFERLTTLEICESDLETIQEMALSTLQPSQIRCEDPMATRVLARKSQFPVCVISDARFKEKYGGNFTSAVDMSISGSDADENPQVSPVVKKPLPTPEGTIVIVNTISPSPTPRTVSYESDLVTLPNQSSLPTPVAVRSLKPSSPQPTTSSPFLREETGPGEEPGQNASSNTAVIVTLGCIAAIALVGFVLVRQRKRPKVSNVSHASLLTSTDETGLADLPLFAKDVVGEDLTPFRLIASDITDVHTQERDDGTTLKLATLNGRIVVIRGVHRGRESDHESLQSFVQDLRLAVQLDHPRLVEFIGFTLTLPRDFNAVVAFMTGGDLRCALHDPDLIPQRRDWFELSHKLKPKLEIAMDVVLAMTYLHSFQPQIVHGKLSTRKVLLDECGDAKLSTFGIAQWAARDSTIIGMIHEPLTIAPEVLRGEQHNDRADVYAFGLLLVEMNQGHSPQCHMNLPRELQTIVASCMNENPGERPSFMQLHYEMSMLRSGIKREDQKRGTS